MAMLPDEARQPLRQRWRRSPLLRRALTIAGVILLLGGFVWLWWQGVPALYRDTPNVNDAERLKATTDTRTALLAGLVGIGALGTFWLNGRTYRITLRGHLTDRYSKAIERACAV